MIKINPQPCEMCESFVADATSDTHLFEVRSFANSGATRVRIANISRDLSVAVYLTADELDTLATMLRDAYNSQEREA